MITMTRLLADTWALLKSEADLIGRIAAPFVFLPAFAVRLLADPLPPLPSTREQAVIEAWFNSVTVWGQANAGWYLLADAVGVYGLATLALLLTDSAGPDVRAALGRAARLFPRFLLTSILIAIPVGLGMWLLILPGLYVRARLIAAAPALAAEQPLGAARSLARSVAVTRGAGWGTFGAVVVLFLLQWLAISPLAPLDAWLREPAHLNPIVLALVDAGLAAVSALHHVALLLLGVVAYRRLAISGT